MRHALKKLPPTSRPEIDGEAGGGDDGGMEARVSKLESLAEKTAERLTVIERDVAIIRSNYATKADIAGTKGDIAEAKNSIVMWVVSAVLLAQLLPAVLKKFGM
jgi:hypothetical protein